MYLVFIQHSFKHDNSAVKGKLLSLMFVFKKIWSELIRSTQLENDVTYKKGTNKLLDS